MSETIITKEQFEGLERSITQMKERVETALKTKDGLVADVAQKAVDDVKAMRDQLKAASDEEKAKRAELEEEILSLKRHGYAGADEVKQTELNRFAAAIGAESVTAKEYRDYREAGLKYLKTGEVSDNLLEGKAMSVDSNADGGFLVVPQVGRTVEFMHQMSPMWTLADIMTVGANDAIEGLYDLDLPDADNASERATSGATTTPNWAKYRIPLHIVDTQPAVTQKMLRSTAFDVEAWLMRKVDRKIATKTAAAFVNGTGSGEARGFLTHTAGTPAYTSLAAYAKIQQRVSGGAGAFASSNPADPLIKLKYDMKREYRPGSVWAMNSATLGALMTIKDADGQYIMIRDFSNGVMTEKMLGHTVEEFPDMPDIAADSLSIAFANFADGYQIADVPGYMVLRDPYSNKPYISFYTQKYYGGDVVNFEAIKLMKFAAS